MPNKTRTEKQDKMSEQVSEQEVDNIDQTLIQKWEAIWDREQAKAVGNYRREKARRKLGFKAKKKALSEAKDLLYGSDDLSGEDALNLLNTIRIAKDEYDSVSKQVTEAGKEATDLSRNITLKVINPLLAREEKYVKSKGAVVPDYGEDELPPEPVAVEVPEDEDEEEESE